VSKSYVQHKFTACFDKRHIIYYKVALRENLIQYLVTLSSCTFINKPMSWRFSRPNCD